jgi:hypothetical protein
MPFVAIKMGRRQGARRANWPAAKDMPFRGQDTSVGLDSDAKLP